MLMTGPLMPCGLEWSGFGALLGRGVWPRKANIKQARLRCTCKGASIHNKKQPPKRLLGFDAHGDQKPFKALLAVLVDIPSER